MIHSRQTCAQAFAEKPPCLANLGFFLCVFCFAVAVEGRALPVSAGVCTRLQREGERKLLAVSRLYPA